MSHTMPSISVSAKPLTGPIATTKSTSAETNVTRSASTDVPIAWRVPDCAAERYVLPSRISSWKRSLIRIELSAAIPMVSTTPAMPGSDRAKSPNAESTTRMPRKIEANTNIAVTEMTPRPR